MQTLVINPYSATLLNALNEAIEFNLGKFFLVGDKVTIIEKCYKLNIQSKKFTIYDISEDLEIVDFSLELLKEENIDAIIFGDFPEKFQNKILNCEDEKCYRSLEIIDIPFLKHFLFVSSYSKDHVIDYDDKKLAILNAKRIMNSLGIKQLNVALISNLNAKVDFLEASVIDVILKKEGIKNIKIYDNFNIYNLFLVNSKVNIFNSKINLLIFKNYEASQIFIDTLKTFANTKIANFILGDVYGMNENRFKDQSDILFGLIILNKIHKAKLNHKELNVETG